MQIGKIRSRSPGIRSLSRSASRARIQLRLPITVLISPLWAMKRNGWASGQLGNVLVEKRECTTRHRGGDPLVGEVGEDRVELVGRQHALVDERARRTATGSRRRSRTRRACAGRRRGAPAPCRSPGRPCRPRTAARRSASRCGRWRRGVVASTGTSRHPRTVEALLVGDLLDALAGLGDGALVAGQERGAHGVRPRGRQVEVDDLAEEGVGHLQQDARRRRRS